MGYKGSEISAWCECRGIVEWIGMLSDEDLNNHLSRFISEANRQDGAPYSPDMFTVLTSQVRIA